MRLRQSWAADVDQRATQGGPGGYGVLDYTYDLNGNRLTRKQTIGAVVADNESYAYAAGTNRLSSVNDNGVARSMSYIASGSIASDSRGTGTTDDLSFGYNAAGRIVTVSKGGAVINRYVYNHMGERVEKRTASNALVERYHYGLEGELLAITGSTGNVIAQYVYLDGLLLAEVSGTGVISFIHSDHLGTPQKVSNSAGTVINDYRWQPFGEAMPANTNHRVKFPGQHFDAETSLHYNTFRTYDPTLGRYLEHDPIGLEGGWNRYGYVGGNPLANIDPQGLFLLPTTPTSNLSGLAPSKPAPPITGAIGDFGRNYMNMRTANTIGADKYFHCKANCQATRRGEQGEKTACLISNARENIDQKIKGDPPSASADDQKANIHGRMGAKSSSDTCEKVCGPLRPAGLPDAY
jgi:RHS repeat-associated protein